jgi:hypothetical protein
MPLLSRHPRTQGRRGRRRDLWQHRGKKSRDDLGAYEGVQSWPVALRKVRAWLEPGIMLRRYWQGWSAKPPPSALQRLLDWLWEGRALGLYIR